MLRANQILVRTLALAASAAALTGCGQRGPLYLPTDPSANERASLPQSLTPTSAPATKGSTPSSDAP